MLKFLFRLIILVNLPIMAAPVITKEQKKNLRKEILWLSSFQITYNAKWTDPETKITRNMDCSNTAKYIYSKIMGVDLPRTSYDQYRLVEASGNFRPAPIGKDGKIDSAVLKKKLRTGDLLFWTNTHSGIKEGLDPPVGHVMIYMGLDKKGNMKAGGSNTFGRGRVVAKGGVDIFDFDPNARMGCFKDSTGKCIRESEFIGYGRPPL